MINKFKSNIEYIFYFFYFSIVLGVLFHWNNLYPYKIALGLVFIYFLFYIIFVRKYKNIFNRFITTFNVAFIFYFFIIYYVLTYFWIEYDFNLYKQYIANLFKCILIPLILIYYIDNIEKLKIALFILSISFIIEIVFGLLQIYPNIYMPNSNINYPSTIPTGFEYNQNDFGYVLGIISPFVLFLSNSYLKILLGFLIFIIILNIGSIVALVSIIFSVIFYLLFIKKMYKIFFVIFSLMFILFFSNIYKSIFPESIVVKIDNFDKILNLFDYSEDTLRTGSSQHKYEVNKIIFDSLSKTNYLGLGAGQSFKELEKNKDKLTEKNFSVHNFWIEMLADAGLFFTVIFFVWYLFMIIKLIKIYLKENEYFFKNFAGATALSFIVFLISSMSPSSVFHMYTTWLLFGIGSVILNINKNNSLKNFK